MATKIGIMRPAAQRDHATNGASLEDCSFDGQTDKPMQSAADGDMLRVMNTLRPTRAGEAQGLVADAT
ncbi:hypothetical protein KEM63_01585 [Halopseudomonas nanhaiensis]|uniref:hypothetical protein n=1 Tax=Halopseudomonas nanhaiensis TaxID=2830842 RepID=UPI001CC02389|nr:hypothetical protein [Halopseudomonas nanhaiensis]UAW98704.1 hypothetical protein KEM63_01585 [Halopseudomonas nanhaiensis]